MTTDELAELLKKVTSPNEADPRQRLARATVGAPATGTKSAIPG